MTLHYNAKKWIIPNNNVILNSLAESWTNFHFCKRKKSFLIISTLYISQRFSYRKYIEQNFSQFESSRFVVDIVVLYSWWCVFVVVVALAVELIWKTSSLKNIFQIIYFKVSYCIFSLQNGGFSYNYRHVFFFILYIQTYIHNIHFLYPQKVLQFYLTFYKKETLQINDNKKKQTRNVVKRKR